MTVTHSLHDIVFVRCMSMFRYLFNLILGQQAILSKVYQFVVALGVMPHLSPGVGLPLSARSKHGAVISSLVKGSREVLEENMTVILDVIKPSNVRKYSKLYYHHTQNEVICLAGHLNVISRPRV